VGSKELGVQDVLVRPGDGETITERDRRNVVVLTEREDISLTWSRYAPGERGPDLHVHREHTDAFYVLDGELTFELGPRAERRRVSAGGFVAVPPNVVHSFVNVGSADARFLNLHAPDKGFAAYLRARRDGDEASFDSARGGPGHARLGPSRRPSHVRAQQAGERALPQRPRAGRGLRRLPAPELGLTPSPQWLDGTA
jgi:quercetin dioxygenase-like cupin family protein